MKAGRETETHTFAVEHVGVDLDFHHPKGRDLLPAPDVVAAFELAREHAEIFIQSATGIAFSCDEILNWFLLQTRTTLAEHMPPGVLDKAALDKTEAQVMLTVPIRLKPGMFHMQTEDGDVDLAALKLFCKVTVRPRGH